MTQPVLQDRVGSTLLVTINREARRNALSGDVAEALLDGISAANTDAAIRSIVLRGAGTGAFSSGADLKERAAADAEGKWRLSRNLLAVNRALLDSPKISYAAISGWCLGGGLELALSCDFRISDATGMFGWPEVKLGAYPGAGAAVLLPRLMGSQAAKRFLLSTRNIDAKEAAAIGLVDNLADTTSAVELCLEWAQDLDGVAPLAQAAIKGSLRSTMHLPLAEAFEVDGAFRKPLEATEDYQEGIKAFFDKRKPRFTGA